jgi:hypothetical protein
MSRNLSKSLSTIQERTFYGCKSLKTIIIPDSVKTIGDSAFNLNSEVEV